MSKRKIPMHDLGTSDYKWEVLTCRDGYTILNCETGERTYLNTGSEGQRDWKALHKALWAGMKQFNTVCEAEFNQCKARGAISQTT